MVVSIRRQETGCLLTHANHIWFWESFRCGISIIFTWESYKIETLHNIHAVKNETLFMITVFGFTFRLSPYKTKTVVW